MFRINIYLRELNIIVMISMLLLYSLCVDVYYLGIVGDRRNSSEKPFIKIFSMAF